MNSITKYTGQPYSQENPPGTSGYDCSSVIQAACRDIGINISRTTWTQVNDGHSVGTDPNKASPGDCIYYNDHTEMIWSGQTPNLMVFSEADYGTVAGVRPWTGWPIIDIRRFTDGPADGSQPNVDLSGIKIPGASDIPGVSEISSVVKVFSFFADPHNWLRVAYFALGLMGLALGVWQLIKNTTAGKAIKGGVSTAAKVAII